MKKLSALLISAGIVLVSFSIANGHSEWAYYLANPVPEDAILPQKYLEDRCVTDEITGECKVDEDGDIIYETWLNCCGCHGVDGPAGVPFKGFCKE